MANARLTAVTRDDLVKAGRRLEPKTIQKWSVLIGNKEMPVKQVLMEAANSVVSSSPRVTPADFTAHYAVNRLRRLGFTVRYAE